MGLSLEVNVSTAQQTLGLLCISVALVLAGCGDDGDSRGDAAENTLAACSDQVDNDGDTFVDCDDQDCQVFTACEEGSGDEPWTATGEWRGTWQGLDADVGGDLQFEIVQDGTELTGIAGLSGAPCFSSVLFRGQIDPESLEFQIDFYDPEDSGRHMTIDGVFTGETLEASYTVGSWGLCTDGFGVMQATRQGGADWTADGTWRGTYQFSEGDVEGDMVLVVSQDGGQVDGQMSMTGAPCISSVRFSGLYISGQLWIDAIDDEDAAKELTISGTVDRAADTIDGSFEFANWGVCTGFTGTFLVERAPE